MNAPWNLMSMAALLAGSLFAADLFPLQEGNTWTYRENRTGAKFTVQVGAPVEVNGNTYYGLEGYVNQPLLVRLADPNRLVYVDKETGAETLLTSFGPADNWDAPMRGCGEKGHTLEKRGTHEGAIGVVHDVLEVRYRVARCADAGVESEQYAENIGMLRRVSQSIAGPRQYDLIYAKVGEIVMDGLRHARFSLSIEDRPGSAVLLATLRLQTNSPLPFKLQFTSGQEYDLALRASDGKVVWTWSADRSFIESLHQLTINGEWSKAVEVPRPDPGTYTLEAWLTATSGQFAATIPLP